MRRFVLLPAASLFVGTAMAVVSSRAVQFAAHVDFHVGSSPLAIVTADFNRDTHPDIAVANNESDNVSVLLGNGTGGFTATGPFSAAGGPAALAVGDFNKDTMPDLVVAADVDNAVSVLLGNGNGTFSAAADVEVGISPDGIAVGDFNNDGNQDFANTNYFDTPGTVTVFLGNGNGTFQSPPLTAEVDGGPVGIAVGRLNADNNDDLIVGGYNNGIVFVLLGNGDGTFQDATTHEVGLLPTGIVILDLNQDAKVDVAVANEDSDSVAVLLGDGNGGFAAAVEYDVGSLPQGVAAADFNGDGIIDLVTADYFGTEGVDNSLSVMIGNGDGTFAQAQSFQSNVSPFGVVAANFGGHELPDLASVNLDSNDVSLLINETIDPPTPTVTETPGTPTSTPTVAPTFTPSLTRTASSTPIVSGVEIRVETVNAQPGSEVAVKVVLARHGEAVAGTQNDITFDPNNGANLAASASCVINPAISDRAEGCTDDPNSGPCKQLNRGLDDVGGGRRFRGLILSLANTATIPDGTLYTCTFTVAQNAGAGAVIPLTCSNQGSFDTDGAALETVCISGEIRIVGATPTTPSLTPTVTPTPTVTRTRTQTPTFSATPPIVEFNIGSVRVAPGRAVRVPVGVRSFGFPTVATTNEITFANDLFALDPAGCRIETTAPRKELLASALPANGRLSSIRVFVSSPENNAPIPDGPLYSCSLRVLPSTQPGEYALSNGGSRVFGPSGLEYFRVTGSDGTVVVSLVGPTCPADCDGNGRVAIDELVKAVRIALAQLDLSSCINADRDSDGTVKVNELVSGVNAALQGCE